MNELVLARDIEIIVLTHDRADYLRETLASIYRQNVEGFTVTVLDNASTDHTTTVVSDYSDRGCRHLRHDKNVGGIGNFVYAMTLSSKPWVMLFHDDDIMAPNYVETLLSTVNLYRDLTIVGSSYRSFSETPPGAFYMGEVRISRPLSAAEFAAEIISGQPLAFCSVLYRTDRLRTQTLESEKFGKICDYPLIYSTIGDGKAVIVRSPLIHYRVHPGRDSVASATGPFVDQVLALNREYRVRLARGPFSQPGRHYLVSCVDFLLNSYTWIPSPVRPQLLSFLVKSVSSRAIDPLALLHGLSLAWVWKGGRKLARLTINRGRHADGDSVLLGPGESQ